MIRYVAVVAVCTLLIALPAVGRELTWLVITASGQAIVPLLQKKAELAKKWPNATLIRSSDCKNLRSGLYMLAVAKGADAKEAEGHLRKVRQAVPDAYIRKCEIREQSLLAFGLPVVHSSIEGVPADAVNWSDKDRTSELKLLDSLGYLFIERTYDPAYEGPREGRAQAVYFIAHANKKLMLLDTDCWGLGSVDHKNDMVAFHCASRAAADHIIHTAKAFRLKPVELVFTREYCRNPRFGAGDMISCEEERVDAQGKLHLVRKSLPLGKK